MLQHQDQRSREDRRLAGIPLMCRLLGVACRDLMNRVRLTAGARRMGGWFESSVG